MGRITKELEIQGNKKAQIVEVLFDSGAEESFIRQDLAEELCNITPSLIPAEFILGDGKTNVIPSGYCALTTAIQDYGIGISAWVIEEPNRQLIIGADVLQKYNIKLDFEHHEIDISQCRRKFELI